MPQVEVLLCLLLKWFCTIWLLRFRVQRTSADIGGFKSEGQQEQLSG